MLEIRIHGRGGQGAVLASRILAWAFFRQGKFVQSFPFFGVERRGAPVFACTRVSDAPIRERCLIREPTVILVLDPHLSLEESVFTGLKEGGTAVMNLHGEDALSRLPALNGRWKVFAVDGSGIALSHGLGTATSPIVNTVMVGAFGKATGLLSVEDLTFGIEKVLGKKSERDIAGMEKAYRKVERLEVKR
ncbi:MAG: pyruvate ferredoxin oxidoreductase [Deltaproteobacteria bacterium]|nr:MAG: pyruvate ferredoxin oxidoreductase [Deltaproteobacteria bacterium]